MKYSEHERGELNSKKLVSMVRDMCDLLRSKRWCRSNSHVIKNCVDKGNSSPLFCLWLMRTPIQAYSSDIITGWNCRWFSNSIPKLLVAVVQDVFLQNLFRKWRILHSLTLMYPWKALGNNGKYPSDDTLSTLNKLSYADTVASDRSEHTRSLIWKLYIFTREYYI